MSEDDDGEIDLERALAELEALVDEMESGELPLEEAMRKFERGVALTRTCRSALEKAEQRVEILLGEDAEPEPFEPED